MKNFNTLALCLALVVGVSSTVMAQPANQDVTIIISDISALSVSSGSLSMTINAAVAGSDPTAVTDNSSTYSVTSNGTNKKVTAVLGSDYAAGITLEISLTAPAGATSAGLTTLSTVAQDLVTGITKQKGTGLAVSYTASATASVDPNGAGEMQTVTITLTS